jgi:hypothetical protein
MPFVSISKDRLGFENRVGLIQDLGFFRSRDDVLFLNELREGDNGSVLRPVDQDEILFVRELDGDFSSCFYRLFSPCGTASQL